jgi:hypothetical protein
MKTVTAMVMGALMALVMVLGIGCEGVKGTLGKVDKALFTPTAWVTNTVPERVHTVETNVAQVVTATNEVGAVVQVTNRVPAVVQIVTPAHTEVKAIGWEPNANAAATAQIAGSFVPGWGQLASTAFVGVLGIIAQLRSRKFKEALVSTCQGVEYARQGRADVADSIKGALNEVHKDDGVAQLVAQVLQQNVGVVPAVKV